MKQFLYNGTTCCLEDTGINNIPNYANKVCLDAAIANGCLAEGQIVSIPSDAEAIPLVGDADRLYINTPGSGYVPVVSNTGGTYGVVCATPDVTYTFNTNTLNMTNLTVSGCINGTPYTDYVTCSQLGDYVTATCLSACCYATETCAKDLAENCACAYFEDCFACCFACCIAEWWDCHRGDVNTSDPGRDNALWVI